MGKLEIIIIFDAFWDHIRQCVSMLIGKFEYTTESNKNVRCKCIENGNIYSFKSKIDTLKSS